MPSIVVAMVLAPTSEFSLRTLPIGIPAWVASTPQMQSTVVAAKSAGLAVTELSPNGTSPTEWLQNHLDSLDQHHNEFSQAQPYTELWVFGVEHTPDLFPFLAEFGFSSSAPTEFGFLACKEVAPNATLTQPKDW